MFDLKWTPTAATTYEELRNAAEAALRHRPETGKTKSSKQEGLFKQVKKALDLLRNNPKHPGLHTHEYQSIADEAGSKIKVFEAYAQNDTPGAYRIFWSYGPKKTELTIQAITPHP